MDCNSDQCCTLSSDASLRMKTMSLSAKKNQPNALHQIHDTRLIELSPRQDLVSKSTYHFLFVVFQTQSLCECSSYSPDHHWRSRVQTVTEDGSSLFSVLTLARKMTTVHYLIKHPYCSYQEKLFTFLGFLFDMSSIHYPDVFSKQNECGIWRIVLMVNYQSAGIVFPLNSCGGGEKALCSPSLKYQRSL